ncbi:Pr6Pr family membrane protein [Mycolicibacterium tusciae]|uniref:Pr6Pr family membrane protein n=1 Tax=Mycolicibacterium tusciae TaxID=75922 RepID=UPI00024A47D9|nr:Pr6Pr family membrane protein [Mycolicibacterium tusciae]
MSSLKVPGASRRHLTLLSVSIVVIQVVAVICQFTQGTDPRFPLLYFTVDSAVLSAVVALFSLLGWQGERVMRARLTAVVGVLVSAMVFAAVIVPATETGTWFQPHDDLPVRTATVLMHAVAPILVTLDYVLRRNMHSIRIAVLWAYSWPLAYIGGLNVLALILGSDMIPYPFLQPAAVGWPTVAGAVAVLAVLVGLLGAILGVIDHAVARRSVAHCAVDVAGS